MDTYVINKKRNDVALVTATEARTEFYDWEPVLDVVASQAARIAELEAWQSEARQVLKPFAHPDLCAKRSGNTDGDASPIFGRDKAVITLGDCRRARDLLAQKG